MTVLVVVSLVWLLVLTVMLLGVSRQLGVMAVATGLAPGPVQREDLVGGQAISEDALKLLAYPPIDPAPDGDHEERFVFWLSSSCSSCVSAATAIRDSMAARRGRALLARSTFLVSGDGVGRSRILEKLEPLIDRVIADPGASALAAVLRMPGTPCVLAIRDGVVSGWADITNFEEFGRLADAGSRRPRQGRRQQQVTAAVSSDEGDAVDASA